MNPYTSHSIEDIPSRSSRQSIPKDERDTETETSSITEAPPTDDGTSTNRNVAREEGLEDGTIPTVSRMETSGNDETLSNDDHPIPDFIKVEAVVDGMKISRILFLDKSSHPLEQPTFQSRSTDDRLSPLHELPPAVPTLNEYLLRQKESSKNVGEGSTKIELIEPHMQQSIPEAGNSAPTVNKSLSAHSCQSWDCSKSFSPFRQTASYTSAEMNKTVYPEHSGTDAGMLSPRSVSQESACGNTTRGHSSSVQIEVASSESLESETMSLHARNTEMHASQNVAQSSQSVQRTVSSNRRLPHRCESCPQLEFWSARKLYVHYSEKHRFEYKIRCRACKQVFLCIENLRQHIRRFHSDPNVFKCLLCDAAFSNSRDFNSHEEDIHR